MANDAIDRTRDNIERENKELQNENMRLQNELHKAELKKGRSGLTKIHTLLGVVAVALGVVAAYQQVRIMDLTITEHEERDRNTREILRNNRYEFLKFMDKLMADNRLNLNSEDRESAALTAAFFLMALGDWKHKEVKDYLEQARFFDEKSCLGSYGLFLIGDMEFGDIDSGCQRRIRILESQS